MSSLLIDKLNAQLPYQEDNVPDAEYVYILYLTSKDGNEEAVGCFKTKESLINRVDYIQKHNTPTLSDGLVYPIFRYHQKILE